MPRAIRALFADDMRYVVALEEEMDSEFGYYRELHGGVVLFALTDGDMRDLATDTGEGGEEGAGWRQAGTRGTRKRLKTTTSFWRCSEPLRDAVNLYDN